MRTRRNNLSVFIVITTVLSLFIALYVLLVPVAVE